MAVQKNFIIHNGLEVNSDLIFADKDSNKVGIATTNPRYTLHVNGGIGATTLNVTGVSTFSDLIIGGKVGIGTSFGSAGQYLVSTGTGVTWGAVPTVRSIDLQTAGVGATTFNTTYSVGLLDVYINGVKLSADEYTANNGATVALDDACFGGETVEFISYSPFGIGIGGTAIQGITILDEGSPVGGPAQVTSINFVGAAVTAIGSGLGVTVYLSNYVASAGIATYATTAGVSTVSQGLSGTPNIQVGIVTATNVVIGGGTTQLIVNGNARITGILTIGTSSITLDGSSNTINVGSGVTIDGSAGTISATTFVGDGSGLVNVVGSGSGIVILDDGSTVGTAGTIDFGANLSVSPISAGVVTVTAGTPSQWVSTAAGINTLSNVGIGTTNPTSALTVTGSGTSTAQLYVVGFSTFVGYSTFRDYVNIEDGVYVAGVSTFVGYSTFRDYVNIEDGVYVSGISTFIGAVGIGTTNLTSALTVKGNTSLETLTVSGVSTFNDDVYFIGQTNDAYWDASLYQGSLKFEDNARIVLGSSVTPPATIYSDGTRAIWNGTLSLFGGLEIGGQTSGINTIARFRPTVGDGSDNVQLYYGGNKKFETIGVGVTVTGTTFTNQLNVSGISTFAGITTVTGPTLFTKQLNVSGVSTFTGRTIVFKGTDFGDTIITDGSIYNTTGFSTFFIGEARGVDFPFQSGQGKVRLSSDDFAPNANSNNGRIGFYDSSNNLTAVWESDVVTGSIYFYNYTNSGTENITISAGSSVVLQHGGTNTKLQTLGTGVTVTGTTFTNQLSVSGISTLGSLSINGTTVTPSTNNLVTIASRLIVDDDFIVNASVPGVGVVIQGSDYGGESTGFYKARVDDLSGVKSKAIQIGRFQNLESYTLYNNGDIETIGTIQVGTGGTVITTTSGGSVGIGSTIPTSKLTVRGGDISVGVSTAHGVILTSPNGTQYRLIVDNSGTLSTVAV